MDRIPRYGLKIDAAVCVSTSIIIFVISLTLGYIFKLNFESLLIRTGILSIFLPIIFIIIASRANLVFYDNMLILNWGVMRKEMMYSTITEIDVPGNFWIAYGLSVKTIQVKCGKRKVSFAPADKNEVLKLLRERCPQAYFKIEGVNA